MKRGRLPLTALRSFEAAGRQLSFSKAAEELFVSQAAISRQIRELETLVGRPLFERLHRRVELTETGQTLLSQLTTSFDDIDRRLSEIISKPAQSPLRVSVEPSFAGEFLIQRLNSFQQRHPEIDISVDADSRLIEFRGHEAEIAIRYGAHTRSWPRTEARHLVDVLVTPVLASGLLASGALLTSPADLRHYTLLHDFNRDGWASWFQAMGLPDLALQRGPLYTDAALAMQAAKLGHGVALGDRILNGADLRAGLLVRPFEMEVPYGAYWLVAPDFQRLSRQAEIFVDWLVEELRAGSADGEV
ncbi:Transcriptional regulator [Mesorhizobium loti]|nr:Transcriptional regulator [Mesorhizobium loti]